MSRSQGQSRLAGDIERARNGEVAFFLQYRTQRLAAHVFHGDKRTAVFGDVEIIEPHGVRVVQFAGDDRLALEAVEKILVSAEGIVYHLDGQLFVEVEVRGAVHGGHAALADLFLNAVLSAQNHSRYEVGDGAQHGLIFRTGSKVRGIGVMAGIAVLHGLNPDSIANQASLARFSGGKVSSPGTASCVNSWLEDFQHGCTFSARSRVRARIYPCR